MTDEQKTPREVLDSLYAPLTKEQLIELYEEAERDTLVLETHLSAVNALLVTAAVAFEHLSADLREGPGSPNFQFSVQEMVEGGPHVVADLLDAAGEDAVNEWYAPISVAYDELRRATRAARENRE